MHWLPCGEAAAPVRACQGGLRCPRLVGPQHFHWQKQSPSCVWRRGRRCPAALRVIALCALQSLLLGAAALSVVDHGHRHSSGRSEAHFWLAPPLGVAQGVVPTEPGAAVRLVAPPTGAEAHGPVAVDDVTSRDGGRPATSSVLDTEVVTSGKASGAVDKKLSAKAKQLQQHVVPELGMVVMDEADDGLLTIRIWRTEGDFIKGLNEFGGKKACASATAQVRALKSHAELVYEEGPIYDKFMGSLEQRFGAFKNELPG